MNVSCRVMSILVVMTIMGGSGKALAAESPYGSSSPAPAFKWAPATFDTFTDKVFLTVELHGSLLNDVEDRRLMSDSFGYDVKAGWRWKTLGVFFVFEQNMWVTSQFELGVTQGVANLGLGLEVNYLGGYARTSVAIGPSILLFDTAIDEAGNTGFFLDVRPIGMRWPINRFFAITLDPMSFAIVAPALDRIPLVMIQFRTTLGFEFVM